MKKSCGLIPSGSGGPRRTRYSKVHLSEGEVGTREARLDRPGVGDQTLLVFTVWCRCRENRLTAGLAPRRSPAPLDGALFSTARERNQFEGVEGVASILMGSGKRLVEQV